MEELLEELLNAHAEQPRFALRLLGWAARLLPAGTRGDYSEVFRSELHDLVRAGASRRVLVAHCLRVLLRAPSLGRELRKPAPLREERSR